MNRLILLLVSAILLVGTLLNAPVVLADEENGLDIDLGVDSGEPIFDLDDIKPGDVITREIEATNNTGVAQYIGVVCSEVDEFKNLSEVLEIVIKANGITVYGGTLGVKTVEEFCSLSDPTPLSVVSAGDTTTYTFIVTFPASAGNQYQQSRYVFDLIFGTITSESLVINEVYYLVDDTHGWDCPKDRINLDISENAAGSTNIIDLTISNTCIILQQNSTNIQNRIRTRSETGKNILSSRLFGRSFISTGNALTIINIFDRFNFNFGSCCCGGNGQNNEWIEIYNPTNLNVSLKNWVLVDNSGIDTIIHSNTILEPNQFALVSKSASTWMYWDENPGAEKVQIGSEIGDGLDNAGDHIYLINPDGEEGDFVAWGNDTERWVPAVPGISLGSSIERLSPGFDNNVAADWFEQTPPTPGD